MGRPKKNATYFGDEKLPNTVKKNLKALSAIASGEPENAATTEAKTTDVPAVKTRKKRTPKAKPGVEMVTISVPASLTYQVGKLVGMYLSQSEKQA